jgi:hypothetical protein
MSDKVKVTRLPAQEKTFFISPDGQTAAPVPDGLVAPKPEAAGVPRQRRLEIPGVLKGTL